MTVTKVRKIVFPLSCILLLGSIAAFIIFKDKYYYICSTKLLLGLFGLLWYAYYSEVKPIWAGIMLIFLNFNIFIILLYIDTKVFKLESTSIGPTLGMASTAIICLFRDKITSLLVSVFKKK